MKRDDLLVGGIHGRHRSEGEGSECVACAALEKAMFGCLAPSHTLPHAVAQVQRVFRRFFVKMCRRHRSEGEGSENVARVALEKGHVFGGFLKPPKT